MVCYNLIEACIYKVDKIMFFNFYIIVIVLIYQTSVYQAPGEPLTGSLWVWSIVWDKLIMAVIPVNLDISVAYHNRKLFLAYMESDVQQKILLPAVIQRLRLTNSLPFWTHGFLDGPGIKRQRSCEGKREIGRYSWVMSGSHSFSPHSSGQNWVT